MKLLVYFCYFGFYRPNGMESPLHIMRMRQRPAANPFKHIPSMYGKCRVIELHFCFDPFYRQQIQLEAENANSTRIENYVQIAIFAKSNAQNGETNTRLRLNSMIQSWRRRNFLSPIACPLASAICYVCLCFFKCKTTPAQLLLNKLLSLQPLGLVKVSGSF